ncbi:MAG: cytochrome b/b6 domain-containing protein, partial [Acidimicrobiales bacterium]
MAEAIRPPESASAFPRAGTVLRFDRVERIVHWVTAALFGVLIVTGATLYVSPIMRVVGHRQIVELSHLAAGLALPIPLLAAVAGRWGRGLRADMRRFNRWTSDDVTWLRASVRGSDERRVA